MVERIRILLESRQLTPTQFADLIGVARPIISHVLSGRNKPSLEVVQRILAAMPDLSMAWLLNGTEPMLTTAREAVPAAPTPRPPGPVAPPLPLAPPQPVAPVPAPISVVTVQDKQTSINQMLSDNAVAPESAWAAILTPVVPSASSVANPLATAGPVPVARPENTTINRPVMPRRFPMKPSTTELPATAPQMPAPPVLPSPAGSPAALAASVLVPATPVAAAETAVPLVTLAEKEQVVSATEALTAAGASVVAAAAPIALSGTEVFTPAPMPLAADPPAGIPAPTPIPTTGIIPGVAPTLASDMATALFTGAEKPIRRIVIFYRDGSFADYQPE